MVSGGFYEVCGLTALDGTIRYGRAGNYKRPVAPPHQPHRWAMYVQLRRPDG
jgi:hypothetical protein